MDRAAGGGDEIFRLVVEAAPNAIVVVDEEGHITLVNSLTERLFGYPREELLGQPVEVLMPERFRTKHLDFRKAFIAAPEARLMGAGRELRARRKDGSEFPVEIGLSPVPLAGRLLVLASIADITARRLAEDKFRLVVESAPNAIVVADREGRIVLVNSQTENLFGYERSELLGQSVEILVPTRFRAAHPHERRSFVANPRARPMGAGRDLRGRRKDGSEFPIEIGLNPIHADEGMLVLAAIVDITARKHAEEQLTRQAAELARSNSELQQFAYVASHDLQEPLRAVAGAVELLERRYQGKLDARADEYIRHAVEGSARMRSLIQDLLTYSRVDTQARPFDTTDLNRVLATVERNLRIAIDEAGAELTHDELPVVSGDPTQLVQLLQNLIGNALKFRRPDAAPRVHVGASRDGRRWRISVCDNGIGIEPEYGERIFRVFQRLHTRDEYPGTGIGLAICKKVIEHHGGRIWVEPHEGGGSCFQFTLPPVEEASS